MTDPERGDGDDHEQSRIDDKDISATVDLNGDADDSKVGLINANGGAGTDHVDVQIQDPAASSDGEVSFNGLGKDEVMKYADEPFWKRLRMVLFVLFWVGWVAMLVTAVIIIALAPRCPPRPDLKWYQKDSVYQVVPKSFKDSDGDGFGDLKGLQSKMDYIDSLGSKSVWLSGIYKADKGTMDGILDHMDTSATFGKKDELKAWIKKLTKEGKRVILDLVVGHTSKKHDWFVKSQSKTGKYAKYYSWSSQTGSGWVSDNTRKESYMTHGKDNLPALNLENTDVVEEIKTIIKFWLDIGVGGLHVSNVEGLMSSKNKTLTLLADLRKVVDGYSKPGRERFLFSTVESKDKDDIEFFFGEGKKQGLHIATPLLNQLTKSTTAVQLKDIVETAILHDSPTWIGLGLGNQGTQRLATRLGENEAMLNAAHAVQLLMPGTPFNYYGDEYGQLQGADTSKTSDEQNYAPMQWNSQKNAGFTSGDKAWQKIGDKYKTNNVEAGTAHFTSSTPLKVFKDLVTLREKPSFQWGETMVCAPDDSLFMFSRKATRFPFFVTLINLGTTKQTVSLSSYSTCVASKPEGTVRFHSGDSAQVNQTLDFHSHPAAMSPGEVIVIEFPEDEE